MLKLLQEAIERADAGEDITRPEAHDYQWAIDLYDNDKLTEDTFAALVANREVMHHSNSDGYNAVQIIGRLESVPEDERGEIVRGSTFSDWVQTLFGLNLTHTARMGSVISHEGFQPYVFRYGMTRYGERRFTWTLGGKMVSSKLDFVRQFPHQMLKMVLTMVRSGFESLINSLISPQRSSGILHTSFDVRTGS